MQRVTGVRDGRGRPEAKLLLLAVRTRLDAAARGEVLDLLHQPLDWEWLLAAAHRHRVAILLYRSLKGVGYGETADRRWPELREHARAFAVRNLYLVKEFARLVRRFHSDGIRVIPYKGPIVAALAYGDIALREFNDLDFLVRRRDLPRVCAILGEDGYQTRTTLSPREQAVVQRHQKEYCFQKGLVAVEPHWSITASRFPFPIAYESLWRRARATQVDGTSVLTFGAEDALLVLCVTGSKSRWRRLDLVVDVAETIRSSPELDWTALMARAQALGSLRMLLLGASLAANLLGALLPSDISRQIQSNRPVRRLTDQITSAMFTTRKEPTWVRRFPRQFSPLLLSMRERPSDKLLYVWRTLTSPTPTHVRRVPLPAALFPLYRVIVPVHDYLLQPVAHRMRETLRRRVGAGIREDESTG